MFGLHRAPWMWMVVGGGVRFLILIGLLILIIVGIWALIRSARRPLYSAGGSGGSLLASNRALDILKERYAKGEIDKEEFEHIKGDLIS